jgi:hypothetical protein
LCEPVMLPGLGIGFKVAFFRTTSESGAKNPG